MAEAKAKTGDPPSGAPEGPHAPAARTSRDTDSAPSQGAQEQGPAGEAAPFAVPPGGRYLVGEQFVDAEGRPLSEDA